MKGQNKVTLAEWWCQLNSFEWPKELPEQYRKKSNMEFMMLIHHHVGHRLCSRVWNKGMTYKEHEDFFNGTFCGDIEANKRYENYSKEKLKIKPPKDPLP